jgi:hypothetical protein
MSNRDVDVVLEVLGGLGAVVIIVWVSVVILLGAG